jgi:broad specificity phosphatase PhoE
MKLQFLRLCLIACLAFLLMPLPASCQVTVILARHAEKGATPPKDPPLTEAGKKRAEALASMLADAGVSAIYVTELQRTQQTAAPLAARVHVKPIVLPAKDTAALINAVRARTSGVVVIVGHSNTIPAIITGLGGPTLQIPETEYDNLFVLAVDGSKSSLLRLHYGSSIPAPPTAGKMEPMMPNQPVK